MKILVVEDEPKLNRGIAQGLQARGYAVESALDGEVGEEMARQNTYDLVILDIMMPKRDGIAVCKNLRAAGKNMPVLFLTARDAVEDRVFGLDVGADDYLVKPFSFDELAARVRTLLRRPPITQHDVLMIGDLSLDTRAQRVEIAGKEIELTAREYGLLEYLLRHKGIVVSREELLSHVWDSFHDTLSNVVDVHLKNLRRKLPRTYAERIQTIWGKGYRLT